MSGIYFGPAPCPMCGKGEKGGQVACAHAAGKQASGIRQSLWRSPTGAILRVEEHRPKERKARVTMQNPGQMPVGIVVDFPGYMFDHEFLEPVFDQAERETFLAARSQWLQYQARAKSLPAAQVA